MQHPSAQIPEGFNQHGIAEKTRNYLFINTLIYLRSLKMISRFLIIPDDFRGNRS